MDLWISGLASIRSTWSSLQLVPSEPTAENFDSVNLTGSRFNPEQVVPLDPSTRLHRSAVRVVWTMEAEHVNDMTNSSNRVPDVLLPGILFWEQIQQALPASTPEQGTGSFVIFPSCRYICQKSLPTDELVIKIISVVGGVIPKLCLFAFSLFLCKIKLWWMLISICLGQH